MVPKVEMTGQWKWFWPLIALVIYGGLLFPLIHLGLPGNRWEPYFYPAYFVLFLALFIWSGRANWRDLGFKRDHLTRHLILGLVPGILLVALIPLLDLFIEYSGMAETDLFRGANQRMGTPSTGLTPALHILAIPLVEQVFFFGFVTQSLIRKMKPASAVYLGTLIFTLGHFDIELGKFFVGLAGAGLYYWTGTIYAGTVFQMICHAGGVLLMQFYPRVLTILGFLF